MRYWVRERSVWRMESLRFKLRFLFVFMLFPLLEALFIVALLDEVS